MSKGTNLMLTSELIEALQNCEERQVMIFTKEGGFQSFRITHDFGSLVLIAEDKAVVTKADNGKGLEEVI